MIENAPLIKIKKSSSRKTPSQSQIKSFENIPTGFICDAMEGYGALSPSIKLLDQSNKAWRPKVFVKLENFYLRIDSKDL